MAKKTDVEKAMAKGIIPKGTTMFIEPDPEPVFVQSRLHQEDATGKVDLSGQFERLIMPCVVATDAPTTNDYLESLPLYGKLPEPNRTWFAAEALAFMNATRARLAFREAVMPHTHKAKHSAKGHIGPWIKLYHRFMEYPDPARWIYCDSCDGSGNATIFGDDYRCDDCKGHGYYT